MAHHHSDHGCIHCACHNPILQIIGEDFISATLQLPKHVIPELEVEEENLILFEKGRIRTLNKEREDEICENMLVQNGKVLMVGTSEAIEAYIKNDLNGRKYETVSLNSKTVLPGFVEPHVHIVLSALFNALEDVSGIDFKEQRLRDNYSLQNVIEHIKEQIAANSAKYEKDWFIAFGIDPAFMPFVVEKGKYFLTNIDLNVMDSISKKVPVLLEAASTHTIYANTPALTIIFDKLKDAKNPEFDMENYKNLKDFLARTKGQLVEAPQEKWALYGIPPSQLEELILRLPEEVNKIFETASARGFTFMYDAGIAEWQKKMLSYPLLFPIKDRKMRLGAAMTYDDNIDLGNHWSKNPEKGNYSYLYYGHVKMVSDGSNQGLTGYQNEDYKGVFPGDVVFKQGLFNFEPVSRYREIILKIIHKGWPLMIHANGDKALILTIDGFKDAIDTIREEIRESESGGPPVPYFTDGTPIKIEDLDNLRHRIEHCSIFTDKETQLNDMLEYGLNPSFTIGHVGFWGNAFKNCIFGPDKADKMLLCKSSLEKRVEGNTKRIRITLNSDYVVSPLGPLRLMEQSITRIMEKKEDNAGNVGRGDVQIALNEAERISPMEALKAVTIDAAWNCNADQWVGSLEPGKFADFVVLDKDPLGMKPADIYLNMRNITVLETWKGGKKVYPNPGAI